MPEVDAINNAFKRSNKKILLADSTKFVNQGVKKVINISEIDSLITDSLFNKQIYSNFLEKTKLELKDTKKSFDIKTDNLKLEIQEIKDIIIDLQK